MNRLVMTMLTVALCALSTFAMPTKEQLKKAQPLVAELMAPLMATYKEAKSEQKAAAAAKVADSSAEFAKAAETEAAKFLLLKGAVTFYARGEQYDKAAETVTTLQREIKDVPPAVIAEITGKATAKISETTAPALYALYRTAKLQVRAGEEAKSLAAKLKKVKSDALQRKYAEALAVSGDWKSAYAEFAKVKNAKLQAIVKDESSGHAKNADAGEFWWAYEPAMEDAEDFFKSHAAAFYRRALAANEISGLKKNLIEQRIKDVKPENAQTAVGEASSLPTTKSTTSAEVRQDAAPTSTGKAWQETHDGKRAMLTLRNGVKMEFVKCQPGNFKMCYELSDYLTTPTAITRPYWFLKTVVTVRQYSSILDPRKSVDNIPENAVYNCTYVSLSGSDESLLPVLNEEFGGCIPKGYVFRVPTWAEYQYAFHANTKDKNDPFYSIRDKTLFRQAMEKANANVWHGLSEFRNGWGIQELYRHSYVLDKIADVEGIVMRGDNPDEKRLIGGVRPNSKNDPLYWNEAPSRYVTRINCNGDGVLVTSAEKDKAYIHLVVGPDLVSEWRAKHGKK